jgi:hypothetical protein
MQAEQPYGVSHVAQNDRLPADDMKLALKREAQRRGCSEAKVILRPLEGRRFKLIPS